MKVPQLLLLAFAYAAASAQTPPNNPSFEVASIRAVEPGLRHEVTIDDEPGMLLTA